MIDLKALYYERFLPFLVESYSKTIKAAKPGHCMKVTGLALSELKTLITMLRPVNPDISIFILSEDETGPDYIRASKLIEMRNDPEATILVLIPANSRTSAEDSYGDATFQNLSAASLKIPFLDYLIYEIPDDKKSVWESVWQVLQQYVAPSMQLVNYVLFVDSEHYSDEAWGNGLFLLGMLPDKKLVHPEVNLRRNLALNKEKCADVICDYSIAPADRVAQLPIKAMTIQKEILALLTSPDIINERYALCEEIYSNHPELNFAEWPLLDKFKGDIKEVVVQAEIVPGKDPKKELVTDDQGNYILSLHTGKKSKVSFRVTVTPSPKENLDIAYFEVYLVALDGFSDVGVLKKVKLTNRNASRKLSVNFEKDKFEDGEYFIRVHAYDADGIILDTDNPFKEQAVQDQWIRASKENPNLTKEQFRLDNMVLFCNETMPFTIDNSGEDVDVFETADKRAKTDNYLQALLQYRISKLINGEEIDAEELEETDRNQWIEGSLNNIYQFDFGPSFAFQIQLPKKLIALERCFLSHMDAFGSVEAAVSWNPTDTSLQHLSFLPVTVSVPEHILASRKEIFSAIKDSVSGGEGLSNCFDITKYVSQIKNYVSDYTEWIRSQTEEGTPEAIAVELQNIDTVLLEVEMPDGKNTPVRLISPLHPLRLAWLVNLYELYLDWEAKTMETPKVYKGSWHGKLEKLFKGGLPLDTAPLVLSAGSLKEPFQYIGELTFGWGAYAQRTEAGEGALASEFRQLKSYTSVVLNISNEKRIDSDVNLPLVVRHIFNYGKAHPYTEKIVINIFNAGDAAVFASALIMMEKIGMKNDYEIRLFSDDTLIQPGDSLKELLNPETTMAEEAEVFSQASANRLFPKLRFSRNNIRDFINEHEKYQAHISFLVNPFPVHTELIRQTDDSRSFFLNAVIDKSVVAADKTGASYVWKRYYSEKTIPEPITEFANDTISLFTSLQKLTGSIMSSTIEESVPATTLTLRDSDAMLLSFIHDVSDWVVTFDKNMGPEFFDLPCLNVGETPYLLDYIPGRELMGVSSFLTTRPTSEVEGLMQPHFKEFGIDLSDRKLFDTLLEDVRSVSSSLLMQMNATQNKAFEVLGITLTKRFLNKKGLLDEAFIIPIDLHKELFEEPDLADKERADNVIVNIDAERRELVFTIVEIKCRKSLNDNEREALHAKIQNQIANTVAALKFHFEMAQDGYDRLDRELKVLELKNLLEFYIKRALRYEQLDKNVGEGMLAYLKKLGEGYTIRFKELGIIFDFSQDKRQRKDFYGDTVIYTMGKTVLGEILSDHETLSTQKLELEDQGFIEFFEPNRAETSRRPHDSFKVKPEPADEPEDPSVVMPVEPEPQPEPEPVVEPEPQPEPEPEPVVEPEPVAEPVEPDPEPEPEPVEPEPEPEPKVEVTNPKKVVDGYDHPIDDKPAELHQPEGPAYGYTQPKYDVLIGKNEDATQYGILGKAVSNKRTIGIALDGCDTISLFGVQGAGKSYTIGSIAEMVVKQFSHVNKLPYPMAGVIFHYSDSPDYAPEFTSMVYPNDAAGQLAKLKAEYGADANSVKDVLLLAPEAQVETRKAEYPDIQVAQIGFDSSELSVKDWMFLLGATGNDAAYVKELKKIMKACRNDMSFANIKAGVDESSFLSNSQKNLAYQKLSFAEEYITDGCKLQQYLHPGRLIIVDLRDEFIDKDEALGLFVVMMNIFSGKSEHNGVGFNKFIVFDEAHKYMDNRELVGSITTAIREMRHKGVSIMIASQDPMSLPTEIIELSSIVIMHRFSSPGWVKHVQKAITALQNLTPGEMANLGSGEAFLWAVKSTDKSITLRPTKISIRPRVTKHGGDTISAVKG